MFWVIDIKERRAHRSDCTTAFYVLLFIDICDTKIKHLVLNELCQVDSYHDMHFELKLIHNNVHGILTCLWKVLNIFPSSAIDIYTSR